MPTQTEEQRKNTYAAAGVPLPISVNSLSSPQTPIPVTTSAQVPIYDVTKITLPDMQQTAPESQASDLSKKLQALNDSFTGQSSYRAEQEQAQGLPALQATQNDLTARLTSLQNEAKAIPLQIQQTRGGEGVTVGGLAPIETAALRNNAIQTLAASSALYASQGNITLAQDMVDRAVTQKYGPIEEEIKAKTANLKLITDSPEYSLADKNRAQKQLELQTQRQVGIDKAKEDSKTIMSWAAAAAANGASSYQTSQIAAVAQSGKPDLKTALSLFTPFARDPQAVEKAVADLEQTRAQTALIRSNAAKVNKEAAQIGLESTLSPNSGTYAGALSVILGSDRFTKAQKQDIINSVNNGSNPFEVVKNQAKNIMGQTQATKLSSYEAANDAMADLKKNMAAYYAAGGKTNLFKGTMEKTVNALGAVDDPKLVSIAGQVAFSLMTYRNAISGTAYSEQEGRDIASVFPGINKSQGLNAAIIDGRAKASESIIDGMYRSVYGSAYDEIKKSLAFTGIEGNQTYAPVDFSKAKGSTVEYNGKMYSVDASGEMTQL